MAAKAERVAHCADLQTRKLHLGSAKSFAELMVSAFMQAKKLQPMSGKGRGGIRFAIDGQHNIAGLCQAGSDIFRPLCAYQHAVCGNWRALNSNRYGNGKLNGVEAGQASNIQV